MKDRLIQGRQSTGNNKKHDFVPSISCQRQELSFSKIPLISGNRHPWWCFRQATLASLFLQVHWALLRSCTSDRSETIGVTMGLLEHFGHTLSLCSLLNCPKLGFQPILRHTPNQECLLMISGATRLFDVTGYNGNIIVDLWTTHGSNGIS